MRSIYEQALGSDFQKLHPKIQQRFGFSSKDNVAAIGRGVMERMWHGNFYVLPGLYLGAWRNIMFPEQGMDVPFTIENYAYKDSFGRETVTWLRTFDIGKRRRFDAYMIAAPEPKRVIDYMGTHQHLSVDLDLSVDERGGLRLRGGDQRFYEGFLAFKFPKLFTGQADVCEWYDDELQKHCIKVVISNNQFGGLFGYNGTFDVEWRPVLPQEIPASAKPKREEQRL